MRRWRKLVCVMGLGLFVAGCPKGKPDYDQGRKAESIQDFDAAYDYYQKALKNEPENVEYQIKFNQARFAAADYHIKVGVKLRNDGKLEQAFAEFQRAANIDPSSPVALQEVRNTAEIIDSRNRANNAASTPAVPPGEADLAQLPPEVKPLSRAPITLTMSNDSKVVFETIGKLAGLTVIFDPDFPAKRITVQLSNTSLKEALDITSVQSKAFWKPVTQNIIMVIPDQPQKRKDYEEQVVRTFYLSNVVQPQDMTDIVTGLRTLLDLRRIQQINSQNAIIVRASPDVIAVADKIIRDIDKAKPEVIVQVDVIETSRTRMQQLGIDPSGSSSVSIVPPGTTTTTNSSSNTTNTSTTSNILTLHNLAQTTAANTSITLPSPTATALLSDSKTTIIQNPELRSIDGQPAKLNIGSRIPIATGSFQAGVGVGSASAGGLVNPLVNTQFQYQDVGVNVSITPRIHPNREVSMKISVEVSSVTGSSNIGGITQPIIGQNKGEAEIRLREGESSILSGLISRSDVKSLSGLPGLSNIPLFHYIFSTKTTSSQDDEILIILTPHIVRLPDWTQANQQPLYVGSETNLQVKHESDLETPTQQPAVAPRATMPGVSGPAPSVAPSGAVAAPPTTPPPSASPNPGGSAQLHFEPGNISMKPGERATIGLAVDNVSDLFSIPFMVQYNPAVISIEDVQHGHFMESGNQDIAIVTRLDKDHGTEIISATRQPNTVGVSGSGTLVGLVVKALAPGSTNLSIVQVNAKDSQQRTIPLVSSEATVQVKP